MGVNAKIKCMVTGGSGFLGQNLVKQLLEPGKYEVVIFDIREPPASAGINEAQFMKGDLTQMMQICAALKGVKIVFHCATTTPTAQNTNNQVLTYMVNVTGTKNVIQACLMEGVDKLVFTSSASVVFEGKDLINVDEATAAYSSKPMDYYAKTKIEAEKIVLDANGADGKLATCALRPSAIFGEGDTVLVPTLADRAKKGKMKYMIGEGSNRMDFTYVANVAQAHVDAAERLALNSPVAGKAYFITNQDPQNFWGFMGDILEGLGYSRPTIKLPYMLILVLAFIFQYIIAPMLKPFKEVTSDLSVSRIRLSKCNRVFNYERSRKELGYTPKVGMKLALERTLQAFEHLRNQDSSSAKAD